MDLFLLKLVVVLRSLGSIEYAETLFDAIGVALFAFAILALLVNAAVRKSLVLGATDITIALFAIWCLATFVIYYDDAKLNALAKLLIPLLSYTATKSIVRDEAQYLELLAWLLAGSTLMAVASTIVIATGGGVDMVNYWTGLARWRGVYNNSHDLGLSMTLFLMAASLYFVIHQRRRANGGLSSKPRYLISAGLVIAILLALFCLYKSEVRTAILGLAVFLFVLLYGINKRLLIIGGIIVGLTGVLTAPYWMAVLNPDIIYAEQKKGKVDLSDVGSGRPRFWRHNLAVFADLPVDQQIAGVGIGNRGSWLNMDSTAEIIDPHSDYLDMLGQTGVVGFALFVTLQVLLFRAIQRLPRSRKMPFLALFSAVNVMMLVSNSYTFRIHVGQLYYIILAYIEVRAVSRADKAQLATDQLPAAQKN
jgi:O-antigen ligase